MNDMTMNTSDATAASAKPKTNKDRIAALEARIDNAEKYAAATAERLEEFGAAVVADFEATKKTLDALGAILDDRFDGIAAQFTAADENFAEVAKRVRNNNEEVVGFFKGLGKKLDEDFADVYKAINEGGARLTDQLNEIAETVNVVIGRVNDHSVVLNGDDEEAVDSGAKADVDVEYILNCMTYTLKDVFAVVDHLVDVTSTDRSMMPEYDDAFAYVRNLKGEATADEICFPETDDIPASHDDTTSAYGSIDLGDLFADMYADETVEADETAEADETVEDETASLYERGGILYLSLPQMPDGSDLIEATLFDDKLRKVVETANVDGRLTEKHHELLQAFLDGNVNIMGMVPPKVDEDLAEVMSEYATLETGAVVAFKDGENASANITQAVMTASALLAIRVLTQHATVDL